MVLAGNEAAVVRAIFSLGTPTRTAISRESSLSLVVVSSVLDALLEKRAITKVGKHVQGMGRPSYVYELAPDVGVTIGLSVDTASVRIVAVDAAKALVADELVALDIMSPSPERASKRSAALAERPAFVRNLIDLCDAFLERHRTTLSTLLAVGIGLPGAVNPRTGVWMQGLRVAGIDQVNIASAVSEHYGVPVAVDDVARTITVYERMLGFARNHENVVVLHLGEGVGAGAVVAGRTYAGHHGLSGEIGHLTVDPNGYRCICGNVGCLETIVSRQGILRRFADRIGEVGSRALAGHYLSDSSALTIAAIAEAARAGDTFTRTTLFEIGSYIGEACTKLVFLYDPELIVVSGAGALLGEFLIDPIRQTIAKRIAASLYPDFDVRFARYEPTHESHGAALLAAEAYWLRAADGRRCRVPRIV